MNYKSKLFSLCLLLLGSRVNDLLKRKFPLMEKHMRHRYNRFFVETGKELIWVFVNTSLNIALTPHIEHFRVTIKAMLRLMSSLFRFFSGLFLFSLFFCNYTGRVFVS